MKKAIALSLVLISLFSYTLGALADGLTFTHPEVGEILTVDFTNHIPCFDIYGYSFYRFVPPEAIYRGMNVNATPLLNDSMKTYEESMQLFFDSVEGRGEETPPVAVEYCGVAKDYAEALNALSPEERITAIRLLCGFEGKAGFKELKKISGFEDVDIASLENGYFDYSVDIEGKKYEYRMIAFHIEEENFDEYYYERYAYVKVDKTWKLARIIKEYNDEYKQRSPYTHGFSGSDPEMLADIYAETLRGTSWGMKSKDVAKLEGVKAAKNQLTLEGQTIFRLPTTLTYEFTKDKLSAVHYRFDNLFSFYSAFVSMYIRYRDPIEVKENGNITWCLNDTVIELAYDEATPVLTFRPAKQ